MDEHFVPFDWQRILIGLQPPTYLLEVAIRCVLVFVLLMLVMRLLGKRGQAHLSSMQQMLLIALGSAAGDALLYPTVALAYAALILFGIALLDLALDTLISRSGRVRDYVEATPRMLVDRGVVDQQAVRKERISERELNAALRMGGARSLAQVEHAILEVNGQISVFLCAEKPAGHDLLCEVVDRYRLESAS